MTKILVAFGTRPEAIKMCTLIRKLKMKECFDVKVMVTGQHKDMLAQVLAEEGIAPDYDLDVMKIGQTLSFITEKILLGAEEVISELLPDLVLVHGDTTSAFAVALAAFYRGVDIGHIEAGLRTHDRSSPFPEEFNRSAIALMAKYHFAPTDEARENLLSEGICGSNIFVSGNTVIDALISDIDPHYSSEYTALIDGKRLIILTAHRRENLGMLRGIFRAVKRIAELFSDVCVIYPVHKNEKINFLAKEVFLGVRRVYLTEPLSAYDFHNLLNLSHLVMTDSGGVQEEAGYLGKPTLILRDTTERKELLSNTVVKLTGTREEGIFFTAKEILEKGVNNADENANSSPYGVGCASDIIADIIEKIEKEKEKEGD